MHTDLELEVQRSWSWTLLQDFLQTDSEWALHVQLPPLTPLQEMSLHLLPAWQILRRNSGSSSSVNASLNNLPLLRNVSFPSFVSLLFLNYSFIISFLDQAIFHLLGLHISLSYQTANHVTIIFYIRKRLPKCLVYNTCSGNTGFLFPSSEENEEELNQQ